MSDSQSVKRGQAAYPVLPLLLDRWSPYVFDPRPVSREALATCLEAARWAASSYNEQPWRFLAAHREEEAEFQRLLGCLLEANQAWAKNAGVLLLSVVSRSFTRNGNPNRMAEHDLGLAVGNLCTQATALGLHVHQMAGINPSKARQVYSIPDGFDPLTAVAIGYSGDPSRAADPQLTQRDFAPRARKPQAQFVFHGTWNRPLE